MESLNIRDGVFKVLIGETKSDTAVDSIFLIMDKNIKRVSVNALRM